MKYFEFLRLHILGAKKFSTHATLLLRNFYTEYFYKIPRLVAHLLHSCHKFAKFAKISMDKPCIYLSGAFKKAIHTPLVPETDLY